MILRPGSGAKEKAASSRCSRKAAPRSHALKARDWSLICDPAANGGNGELRVTLGAETATLPLKPGQKAQGARMDRFGIFTSTAGGQMVKIYLDDLQYSVGGK